MLTLTLLPLGLIAVLQSRAAIDTAHETYRQSLAAQTSRAAQPEAEAITRAFGIARGLAQSMPALRQDPEGCVRVMQRVVGRQPNIGFASFIDTDQVTICNSADRRFDFSGNPQSDRVFEAGEPNVIFNPEGNATGSSVVIISQPVTLDDGSFAGFVSLSFPTTPLAETRSRIDAASELTLITLNRRGELLTAGGEREIIQTRLPADDGLLNSLMDNETRVFTARSVDDRQRDYALVPILSGNAYALGIWEVPRLRNSDIPLVLRAAAFPLLMWLASLVVAVLALRHQVIEPVRELRMRMRDFADGRAIFRANSIPNAPRALQEIGITFEQVADQVMRDEASLEDKIHERDVLLREVHHRVKNNLQLMTSIINMQIRQEHTGEEAAEALRSVQERLASLAKFHQDLYETSSLSKIRTDQLLEDLSRQTVSLSTGAGRQIDLRLDLDPITLQPDQVGPLAMLVTEALTNALQHAQSDGDAPLYIGVSMKSTLQEGLEHITVRIENALAEDSCNDAGVGRRKGLGTRLIAAFASQLEGTLKQEREPDCYIVEVRFKRMS